MIGSLKGKSYGWLIFVFEQKLEGRLHKIVDIKGGK